MVGWVGESGGGDTVAFVGGAGLNVVGEDDVLSLFERGEVRIDCRCVGFGQADQLEIVGDKEAERSAFLQQVFGDGVRKSEVVKGGGTTTDLVRKDEGLAGGVVKDVGGFAHFNHEGRVVGDEVVGGADMDEDPVDGTDSN